MRLKLLNSLAEEGIDVEVIDLRTLKPLDMETIVTSVKKTGRLVGVTEAYENTSFINEVMAPGQRLGFRLAGCADGPCCSGQCTRAAG